MTTLHRLALIAAVLTLWGCAGPRPVEADWPVQQRLDYVGFNLAHLDFLGEDVVHGGDTLRIIHIYAEAPDWRFVGDADEGFACVDDAARAAVVYLRHFEATRDEASRRNATKLLRFIRYMQAPSGLFYNFAWDQSMRINTEHKNSVATDVSWWTARATWALGEGARVLKDVDPAEANADVAALRRLQPHLDSLLANYGQTVNVGGRSFPRWLIAETASDATSELLLGLVALESASPSPAGRRRARQFAQGIAMVRAGDFSTPPWGGHISWTGGWHGWGNSQTQALAEGASSGALPLTSLQSAAAEAQSLYAKLLVDGFLHEASFDPPAGVAPIREFEQIAYDVRPVAVGLARLFEATGDRRYAIMAGIAASWFHGNNPAGVWMADPRTGTGLDGILSPDRVNQNAGAESTVEAQMSLLAVGLLPEAARWAYARAEPARSGTVDGRPVRFRVFTEGPEPDAARAVLVLDLNGSNSTLHLGQDADAFLSVARITD